MIASSTPVHQHQFSWKSEAQHFPLIPCREGGELDLDSSIAAGYEPHTTLVIYMGLATLPALTRQLAAAGMSLATPAVAVERGTTAQQRAVYAEIGSLQEQVRGRVGVFVL